MDLTTNAIKQLRIKEQSAQELTWFTNSVLATSIGRGEEVLLSFRRRLWIADYGGRP